MFTGLVEELGRVAAVEDRPGARRLEIAADLVRRELCVGDSVAVNGCCLTVIALAPDRFSLEAVPETLARTTLGAVREGAAVNLERALRLDQRLGGHLVQGHVDGVGVVVANLPEGDGRRLSLGIPGELRRFVAEKGSIAVDGISLTIAALTPQGCEIALIPHTLTNTVAGGYASGTRVNLEVDLLARYLERLLAPAEAPGRTP